MEENPRSEEVAKRPPQQPPIQPPPQSAVDENPPPQPTSRPANCHETQIEKDIRSGERWLIGVGIFAVLVNMLIAAIYLGQLKQMRQSTDATAQAAYVSCLNAQVAGETLKEIQIGAQDAHLSARSSLYQAIAATLGERAYILVKGMNFAIRSGQPIQVEFKIMNMGKTPATDIKIKMRMDFLAITDDPDFTYPPNLSSYSDTPMIVAGADTSQSGPHYFATVKHADGTEVIATDSDVADYKSYRKDIVFYTADTYKDAFGIDHWTHWCGVYSEYPNGVLAQTDHKKCTDYIGSDSNSVLPPKSFTADIPTVAPPVVCREPQARDSYPWWQVWR